MNPSGSSAAAFADLQWLRRFAGVLAADADDADDLVQETLVAAWDKPAAHAETSLRPWLASVVRNRFRMLRRGRTRRDERERIGESTSASTVEPEREVERLEVLQILLAELEQLPAEDRMIIVRRFFDGESAADIGRALDMPAATVRSRLHRSLRRLRGELDRRFEDRRTWCAALGLGPMVGAEQAANSTGGVKMSITTKAIIAASLAAGVGGAGWAASRGAEPDRVDGSAAGTESDAGATPEKRAWQARRAKIRKAVPGAKKTLATPAPRVAADDASERNHRAYRDLLNDCLEDLDSHASGALTLDIVEIGSPDVGVIYESVEIVETTIDDPELLQCIVESMYAFIGDPPEESYESRTTRTSKILGTPDADASGQPTFDAIVGAHINEVRFCQTKSEGPVAGTLAVALTIAKGGTVAEAKPSESALPSPVVDCVVNATRRWAFPEHFAGRTLEYSFVLPIAEHRDRE